MFCKLNKALYSLKQAPQVWFQKLKITLSSWEFINVVPDASYFIHKFGANYTYALIYVDGILLTCTNHNLVNLVIKKLIYS